MATHELIKGMDALDDAEALVAFLAESLEGKELSEQATLGLAQVFDLVKMRVSDVRESMKWAQLEAPAWRRRRGCARSDLSWRSMCPPR